MPSGLKATLITPAADARSGGHPGAGRLATSHSLMVLSSTPGGQGLAVGAEGHAQTPILVPGQGGAAGLAGGHVPEPDGLIIAPGGQGLAVGAEGHGWLHCPYGHGDSVGAGAPSGGPGSRAFLAATVGFALYASTASTLNNKAKSSWESRRLIAWAASCCERKRCLSVLHLALVALDPGKNGCPDELRVKPPAGRR